MRKHIEEAIWSFIGDYCERHGKEIIWERPIVNYADAANPLFSKLRSLIVPDHYLPTDYLQNAVTVLSYFLPFRKAIAESNVDGVPCSSIWADAYLTTNAMAAELNERMVALIRDMGFDARVPFNAGMISNALPKSRWSQKHVAYIAGHGTFGLNNMMISDKGGVGRYYSIVTTLPIKADPIVQEERCLYKRNGKCGLCARRCSTGALTTQGFDRFKCLEQCLKNERLYPGADICGKCVVGLPCSFSSLS